MWKKILEGMRKKSSTTSNEREQSKITDTTARGVLALMVLIFVFQTVTFTIHKCSDKEQPSIAYNTNPNPNINTNTSTNNNTNANTNFTYKRNSYQQYNYTLFNFNPNTITIDSLKMLGFSERQALTIIHYREKGGRFRKKEDFAKMYSVSDEKYIELEPYINISNPTTKRNKNYQSTKLNDAAPRKQSAESNSTPSNSAKQSEKTVFRNINHKAVISEGTVVSQKTIEQNAERKNRVSQNSTVPQNTAMQNTAPQNSTPPQNNNAAGGNQRKETWNKPKSKVYIDINEADSTTLMSVNGIGPYFCRSILSYRKALGSFYSTEQLLEIKGMDQEKYNRIKDQIFVHPAGVKKFSIAGADRAFLEKHPYIGAYNARGIALFMQNRSKEEITLKTLVENNILTVADTLRLHPYIY